MAQLRLKLPKEALADNCRTPVPEKAWKRLEEQYGNRELSILSALKNLREFKPSKSASHEVMIELASAVQKCVTMLGNVKALDDLLSDRESVACIIHALPSHHKDKWYDKEVPEETYEESRGSVEVDRDPATKCSPGETRHHGSPSAGHPNQ